MRKRIFNIIEAGYDQSDPFSKAYDYFMMVTIIISIIPLWFHQNNMYFDLIDKVTVVIFIADYILRFATADYKLKRGSFSFVRYPFTFMAIIDFISILPSISILNSGFRLLKVFRLFRTFKVFRVFRTFRYSKNYIMIRRVLLRQKDSLLAVCWFAAGYILISALVMFNAEPETFPTMFDAIYWATITLTTIGYGDIYAVSTIGRIVTMVSAVMGIAIVALPAVIVIAGYTDEVNEMKRNKDDEE